ncbi:hypothetical protein H6781_00260 [Candidatus Nomurabacteria bacterium]|nr:hypothetical protein [Candidatus Kaiserbacteria bacterium]MCB9810015.1 hypothetical protein [Candidatus Nomurabacteria bacterium]
MRYLFQIAILFLLSAGSVLAQSDTSEFNVRVFGGTDTIPPTTPTLLTATPVASTQVDLTWSSSTDNYSVAGYTVTRNGIGIATTTLLSYSDTGLVASTTYTYSVRAFDVAQNYSSSSNSLATTTPVPPPEIVEETPEATIGRIVLDELYVETGESTSSLNMRTAMPARLELRWGRTTAYELGYIVSSIYKREHSFSLSDLEPNTTYLFEIIGYTPRGNETVLKTGSFTTNSDAPPTPPSNVGRFLAIANGDDVELSWQNPTNAEFSHVRIVRSYLNFPEYPGDGAIIYQGLKTGAIDSGVLSVYSPVFYTAFVYDIFGNVSSGAIAIVYASEGAGDERQGFEAVEESTMSIDEERLTVDMKMPQLSDIYVSQLDKTFSMLESPIELSYQNNFVVEIPVQAVSGNLKSIILNVLDPTDNRRAYSYLLRINNDRTAYVATVPAFNVLGDSQLKVEIYDYEAYVVGSYQTPVKFTELTEKRRGESESKYFNIMSVAILGSGMLLLALLLMWLFILYKRRAEDKN